MLVLCGHTFKSVMLYRVSAHTRLKFLKKFLKFATSKSCFDPFKPCNISSDINTQQDMGIQTTRKHSLASTSKIFSFRIQELDPAMSQLLASFPNQLFSLCLSFDLHMVFCLIFAFKFINVLYDFWVSRIRKDFSEIIIAFTSAFSFNVFMVSFIK